MNLAQHINLSVDRWPSGRRRSPAKGVGGKPPRGFESLPVRHQNLLSYCFNGIKLIKLILTHNTTHNKNWIFVFFLCSYINFQ